VIEQFLAAYDLRLYCRTGGRQRTKFILLSASHSTRVSSPTTAINSSMAAFSRKSCLVALCADLIIFLDLEE